MLNSPAYVYRLNHWPNEAKSPRFSPLSGAWGRWRRAFGSSVAPLGKNVREVKRSVHLPFAEINIIFPLVGSIGTRFHHYFHIFSRGGKANGCASHAAYLFYFHFRIQAASPFAFWSKTGPGLDGKPRLDTLRRVCFFVFLICYIYIYSMFLCFPLSFPFPPPLFFSPYALISQGPIQRCGPFPIP